MISNKTSAKIQYQEIEGKTLERNILFVRDHLFRNMDSSLDLGGDLIDEELHGISILLRPVVKTFYHNLVRRDLEAGTRKSIDDMLSLGKLMIQNNVQIDSPKFKTLMDKYFPAYLVNDQTGRQCRREHPNFGRLRQNLKTTYKAQIISIVKLLKVNEKVHNYHELCRRAFKTAEECKADLKMQADAMRCGQKIIGEDLSILNILIARHLIFKILRKGFEQKIAEFYRVIDEIYATLK